MTLRTNTLKIRGASYAVTELTARQMASVREIMAKNPHQLDLAVAALGTTSPKMTEAELGDMPNVFAKRLSAEIMRLSDEDDSPKESA